MLPCARFKNIIAKRLRARRVAAAFAYLDCKQQAIVPPKRQPMRRSLVMAANIATTAAVRPTIIFLHGSGDTGRGVEGGHGLVDGLDFC